MEKEENNYVVGFVDNRDGRTVTGDMNGKVTRLAIDYTRPVTLQRCAEILAAARSLSGRPLTSISLRHSVYSKTPGNEYGDGPETCYLDMRYDYDQPKNSLVIFDRGQPIYANDNGIVTRDQAALYDSIF